MSEINKKHPELTELLKTFTHSVLINKPTNLIMYAAEYFNNLKIQHDMSRDRDSLGNSSEDEDSVEIEIMTDIESKKTMLQTSNIPRESIICERFDPSSIDDDTFETNRNIFLKSTEQQEKIGDILSSIFLFSFLEEEQLRRVIESMFPVEVTAGEIIIKENDPGDNFYVIDHGDFSVFNEKGTIALEFTNEGSFGELALLYNCPRQATVVAKSDGVLWAMDRTSFRQLILKGAYNKRKRLESLLRSIPILQELTEYDRCNLADALKTVTVHNTTIIKQGEMGDKMYFIEEGEATVISENSNGDEKIEKILKTGDYFGDVALLAKIPRIATVQALGTIKLAELNVKSYNRLMGPCIDLMRANFHKYRSQLEKLLSPGQLQELFPELLSLSAEQHEGQMETAN